jgi:hypothetical protein
VQAHKTPEIGLDAFAQFLCAAQELSESQILDAKSSSWELLR